MDLLLRSSGFRPLADIMQGVKERICTQFYGFVKERLIIIFRRDDPEPLCKNISRINTLLYVVHRYPKSILPVDERPIEDVSTSIEGKRTGMTVDKAFRRRLNSLGSKDLIVRHGDVYIRRMRVYLVEKPRRIHVLWSKEGNV